MTEPAGTARDVPAPEAARDAQGAFGVYVHWPFCQAKCPYCDFNSHVRADLVRTGADEAHFARALATEIGHLAQHNRAATVTSVFFGGGTPSLMQPQSVAAVLDAIARHWTLSGDAEITLEANPTSIEAGRFAGYRDAGVNRVSIGVQALDDASLRALGRRHDVAQAMAALDLARGLFARVSFDLIYARPGQSPAAWRGELARALAHAPDHLSLYQLTIEPGTPFAALHAAGRLALPGEDDAAAMFEITQALCADAGLPAYEVSNHARPGAQSRHNLVYWRGQPYAGAGPGAHGRLLADGAWRMTETLRDPAGWLAAVERHGHGLAVDAPLAPDERALEMVLMGLRLAEGLDLAALPVAADRLIDMDAVAALAQDGFLARSGTRLRATESGRPVLQHLITRILR